MIPMGTKKTGSYWGDKVNIRTHPDVKNALTMIKSRIGRGRRLTFRGRKMTEEAVFGALMLWADAQDVVDLEAMLKPHLARLETMSYETSAAHEKPPELPKKEAEGFTVETTTINPVAARKSASRLNRDRGGKAS